MILSLNFATLSPLIFCSNVAFTMLVLKLKVQTEMQVQWEHEINRNRVRNAWWRAWHIPSQPSFHPLAKKVDTFLHP